MTNDNSTVVAKATYLDRKVGKTFENTVLVLTDETYPNDLAYKLTILYNMYGMTAFSLPEKNRIFAEQGLPELNPYEFGDGDETESVTLDFYVGITTLFPSSKAEALLHGMD